MLTPESTVLDEWRIDKCPATFVSAQTSGMKETMYSQVMNCGKMPIKPDAALLSPWPSTGAYPWVSK